MSDTITLPREVVEKAVKALEYYERRRAEWDCADEVAITALRKALAAEQPKPKPEPVAWMFVNLDGECEQIEYGTPPTDDDSITPLYTALAAEPVKPITVPKTVPLPPITCGFVDVRFDGERWFCDKCGKRMSADFETSVKRVSEKCYLELMQRKAEAVRTMNERAMK